MSSDQEWSAAFSAATADLADGMTYAQASQRLRTLIASNLLQPTDIVKRPQRFFEAHRILSRHAARLGPGFWIRFTVHFNLFAGTVVALGTPQQIQALEDRCRQRPLLGCFGLTEVLAGVNSGLVVNTTAEFKDGKIVINSPSKQAAKNWISQGLVADEGVVIAMLTVNGRACGMQAFLVPFRDASGKLLPGITAEDMGMKTVGNDLDNARLTFTNYTVPVTALLSRYLNVSETGQVSVPAAAKGKKTMEFIGQRLFTGRVAVAQAALTFAQQLFAKVYAFASTKECWAPNGARPKLTAVPQIAALFAAGKSELDVLEEFTHKIEAQLCKCLMSDTIPPLALQQAIAVGKVRAVEGAITLCFALKQEVGSYALMAGSGFEQLDFLQCCKFAEGDSRILMQKMARDIVRTQKPANELEKQALNRLQTGLKSAGNKSTAWDSCWSLVYDLAEAHMVGVFDSVVPGGSKRTPSATMRNIGATSKL